MIFECHDVIVFLDPINGFAMSKSMNCPKCKSMIRVQDADAGGIIYCSRCRIIIEPEAEGLSGAASPGAIEQFLLDDQNDPGLSRSVDRSSKAERSDSIEQYALADFGSRPRYVAAKSSVTIDPADREKAKAVREAARAGAAPKRTAAEILAAFRGEIRPVRPTLAYRFWSLVIAFFMFLLPMIYLSIIAVVAAALFYHITRNVSIFQGGGNVRIAVVIYALPIATGFALLFFLIKPFFARPERRGKDVVVSPSSEPLLFGFIDGICRSVGAPTPSRIVVDCEINAAASFAHGTLSTLTNDFELRIGLPFVAGLTIDQFAGVLAHEFGHFSQTAGFRLSFFIRSIYMWFYRIAKERDAFDAAVADWRSDDSLWIVLIGAFVQMLIWFIRRILIALMWIGHLVSCSLFRQMEFDADRYEMRLVGSATFESTERRLLVLSAAMQWTYADIDRRLLAGKTPENLPRLMAANVVQMPSDLVAKIDKSLEHEKTSFFSTHPSSRDRIAKARRENAPGIFHLEGPATDVFRDFDGLAKRVSIDFYRRFGISVNEDRLEKADEAVEAVETTYGGMRAIEPFFMGCFHPLRPLPLPAGPLQPPADLKAAKAAVIEARGSMSETVDERRGAEPIDLKLRQRIGAVDAAEHLVKAGARFQIAEFELAGATGAAIDDARKRLERDRERIEPAFQEFEDAAARRIHAALSILQSPAAVTRVHDGTCWQNEVKMLYPLLVKFDGEILADLERIVRSKSSIEITASRLKGRENDQKLVNALLRANRALRETLQEISWKLETITYPFEHVGGEIDLRLYALPEIPHPMDPAGTHHVADRAVKLLMDFRYRLTGRLVLAVHEVERVLGLKPIPYEKIENKS